MTLDTHALDMQPRCTEKVYKRNLHQQKNCVPKEVSKRCALKVLKSV